LVDVRRPKGGPDVNLDFGPHLLPNNTHSLNAQQY